METLVKNRIKYLIPFILLFLFILIQNAFVGYSHDDITFQGFLKTYSSLIEFSKFRYNSWTNRNLIECLILIFLKNNLWVWRIIDAIIYPLIAFFSIKIINKKETLINSVIVCVLVALFYLSVKSAIASTGFLTTSINYTWPLMFLILHFYLLKEFILKNKPQINYKRVLIYLISILSLIFAANNEQLAMVALGIYFFSFIYLFYKKIKIPKFIYLLLIILIIIIINSLICPGNYNRINVALRFYPWYASLNIFDKLNIGIAGILNKCVVSCNLITGILLALLGIFGIKKHENKFNQFICFIPLIIVILFWITSIFYPSLNAMMNSNITKIGYHPANLENFIISIIIYILFVGSLVYSYISIYLLNKRLGYIVIALSIISLGSAVMYGFTPTILSKERMYIFTSACFLIIDYILISKLFQNQIECIK